MNLDHLFEAGIKTAEIDKLARQALAQAIPATVKEVIKQTEADMPPRKMRGDPGYEYEDTSTRGDELIERYEDDPTLLVVPMLKRFSEVLTQVVRDHVEKLIPSMKHITDMIDEFRVKGGAAEWASGYTVEIEARELSTDEYAQKAGGYMGTTNMKVFVDQDKVFQAGCDLIRDEMSGESEDGFGDMLNAIVPTFTHEYAHLEQELRRPQKYNAAKKYTSRDFGYMADKTSRRSRNSVGGRGGRGEWSRNPWGGDQANLRYTGNVREIDSFASGAAAEMMSALQTDRRRGYNWQSYWNANIDDIKSNLVYGYNSHSRSYERYQNIAHAAFDGYYDHVGFKKEQMAKVWKAFVKKVSQKLDDYKIDSPTQDVKPMRFVDRSEEPDYPVGREPLSRQSYAEQFALAANKPFAEGVKALAANRAKALPNDERTRQYVSKGYGDDMHKDEDFIGRYYSQGERHPLAQKAIAIYRNLVGRYMDQISRSAE